MVSTRLFALIATASALSCVVAFTAPQGHAHATTAGAVRLSSSSLHMAQPPKGCAAKPFEKKKIAVFGAGGYLGAVLFGFLQRASSLYGTGISPISSPRAVCSTGGGAEALNKVLGPAFKLAYAGEDLIRLVDIINMDHIQERVKGIDAAILGTTYQLEQRSVTLNTYEKTPNDKTFEILLDERYGAWENNVPSDDSGIHAQIFRNSVQACKGAGLTHIVVVETPRTVNPSDFVAILEEEGMKYTYIRTDSALKKDKYYTFEKGITNKLGVACLPAGSSIEKKTADNAPEVTREDLAALIVQSLMMLDWGESRILQVSATSDSTITTEYGAKKSKGNFAKEWCPNSDMLAEVLSTL